MTEDRLTSILIGIGMVIVIIAMLLLMLSTGHGHEVCLTKSEARELWPKRHIFWYGERRGAPEGRRCWSNRRGPPTGIKVDPIPKDPVFPKQSMAQAPKEEDHCCWPPLESLTTFLDRWYEFPSIFSLFRQRYVP